MFDSNRRPPNSLSTYWVFLQQVHWSPPQFSQSICLPFPPQPHCFSLSLPKRSVGSPPFNHFLSTNISPPSQNACTPPLLNYLPQTKLRLFFTSHMDLSFPLLAPHLPARNPWSVLLSEILLPNWGPFLTSSHLTSKRVSPINRLCPQCPTLSPKRQCSSPLPQKKKILGRLCSIVLNSHNFSVPRCSSSSILPPSSPCAAGCWGPWSSAQTIFYIYIY